jgi:hypothetical protein
MTDAAGSGVGRYAGRRYTSVAAVGGARVGLACGRGFWYKGSLGDDACCPGSPPTYLSNDGDSGGGGQRSI